jgi:hypothetical protein
MKKLLLVLTILTIQLSFSQQEEIPVKKEKSEVFKKINSRKGQVFASWGWNRSGYSKSDITFEGNDFDFTIYDVKADDKPNPFGIKFLSPGDLTLPQTNLEIGYFIKDNYNIVFGYDHMKYVMRNGQDVKLDGTIATGVYDYNEAPYNYDGTYSNQTINLSRDFLLFEHTDGLNYIFFGANRFDNFNELLGIRTDKFEVNLEEGFDFGFVMPKTNTTILGNTRYDEFHVAGFGFGVSAGINLTFFKHFYLKTDFKVGYINMPDIRITEDKSEKAKQHFTFYETAYTFGYRFNL